MKVEIEEYRGWTIYFDTEKETFYSVGEEVDRDVEKKSYAATKKYIDDYIKDNEVFKSFKVAKQFWVFSRDNVGTILGIRRDKRFVGHFGDKTKQVCDYEEDQYFIVDSAEEQKSYLELEAEYRDIIKEESELQKKSRLFKEKVNNSFTNLKEYKKKFL